MTLTILLYKIQNSNCRWKNREAVHCPKQAITFGYRVANLFLCLILNIFVYLSMFVSISFDRHIMPNMSIGHIRHVLESMLVSISFDRHIAPSSTYVSNYFFHTNRNFFSHNSRILIIFDQSTLIPSPFLIWPLCLLFWTWE